MKKVLRVLLLSGLILCSCSENNKSEMNFEVPAWSGKFVSLPAKDSLVSGQSYLPVYSQIYSRTEKRTLNLTVMVSLRNMSASEKVYLTKADYYNSEGQLIKSYLDKSTALDPLETVEIVINEDDSSGGTGGNFLFEWYISDNGTEPLFQAVMNSTLGQQGLSFVTEAKRLR